MEGENVFKVTTTAAMLGSTPNNWFVVLIRYVCISVKHHNKAHRPKGTTMQQLDRVLDDGHEINCQGLDLECSKSRTSRMGIESPVETCTKSRIHWMSVAFHRQQTWTSMRS
ncbi:UNVERIFIED_CONTAM: hypothetical protein Slati_1111700 [Sesamum latifolium]|uniref:Uncharacterized protein n=1 Tax=Sesamum latifolium TaxID=2727402 RepID=A0AAW2XE84_9LAMI